MEFTPTKTSRELVITCHGIAYGMEDEKMDIYSNCSPAIGSAVESHT